MPSDRPTVIAVVTDAIYPYHRGGKETRYHELAPRLSERAEVHVYTMQWWDGPRERSEDGVTYHAICPLVALYTKDRRSVLQALVFAVACLRLLFRRFDVIEADHMPYIQLFPLWVVAKLRRKRLVVTWHESWGPDYWREYLGPAGRAGWWFERAAMRLPDHVIAASQQTADRVRKHVDRATPITVAPNGVDLARIDRATATTDPCDVVVVGRLLRHKRIDLLLDAIALLHDAGSPVTCRIVGDGPERDPLAAHARALGIEGALDLRHDIAGQDELYAVVKSARVFVFPSEREGFGIAVLEAIACGIPVVTTSAPDNLARHLVERSDAGIVCAPDARALADAIASLLAAPAVANTGPAPEAWLAEFDWTAITDRVATAVLA